MRSSESGDDFSAGYSDGDGVFGFWENGDGKGHGQGIDMDGDEGGGGDEETRWRQSPFGAKDGWGGGPGRVT